MEPKAADIIERWVRACCLLHNCKGCPERVECLKITQHIPALVMMLERRK
jgi:hypothetical protein